MFRKVLYGLLIAVTLNMVANAQRLVVGEKAPDVKIKGWYNGRVAANTSKAVLLDFCHPSNDQCVKALPKLNDIQRRYAGLSVIVLQKDDLTKISPYIEGKGYSFFTALDDGGKTYSSYDVRFVPFSVLIDKNGKVAWAGNVNDLTSDTIDRALR